MIDLTFISTAVLVCAIVTVGVWWFAVQEDEDTKECERQVKEAELRLAARGYYRKKFKEKFPGADIEDCEWLDEDGVPRTDALT